MYLPFFIILFEMNERILVWGMEKTSLGVISDQNCTLVCLDDQPKFQILNGLALCYIIITRVVHTLVGMEKTSNKVIWLYWGYTKADE